MSIIPQYFLKINQVDRWPSGTEKGEQVHILHIHWAIIICVMFVCLWKLSKNSFQNISIQQAALLI